MAEKPDSGEFHQVERVSLGGKRTLLNILLITAVAILLLLIIRFTVL